MMEDIEDNSLNQQPLNSQAPGILLRDARQHKNLSQEDVAKQLRLSVQWVKDLENNDYSHAAALIYIRGYLRSYARLVDLSADDIIAAFEAAGLGEAFCRDHVDDKVVKHQTVPIISKSTRIIMNRRVIRWVTSSAVLVLVVAVGIWWQGQKKHGGDAHQMPVVMQQQSKGLQIQSVTPTADTSNQSADEGNTDSAMTQQEDQPENTDDKETPRHKNHIQ